jgi:succinate dehydrogenase/fumarate reductase cytochrome b subunit
LFWDAGKGFELTTSRATSRWVIAATVVLTLATWAIGLYS